ncbi:energy transducer TonB family protein [Alistipes ihumii]|uniref:energy transducer TonB family protein n=1 Tax=Alistipes ihumii TaxID=1470347 RepID=UPI003AB62E53
MDRETKPSQTPRPQPPRQPRARIPLPFEKRPFDTGSWAYEHRVGLCCMVIAYLAFGIVFVSAKIVLQQRVTYNTIYMDLTDLQAALPEEQEPEQRDERSDYRDVRNLVSDENGRNESVGERSASSGNLSEATEEFMESLDEEAAAVRGRMQASREAFERGRREEREMIARHKAQREAKDGEKPSGVKQKGRVLVSYSLPGRTDVYLHTPAYQCEGGGEVTVAITVNRNGKVTAASLKETTTSSNCINETAVTAARNSRFNVDGSAADRQSGTITYIFVPQ